MYIMHNNFLLPTNRLYDSTCHCTRNNHNKSLNKNITNNLVMTTTFLRIINTIKDDLDLINNTLCVTADITIFRKFH